MKTYLIVICCIVIPALSSAQATPVAAAGGVKDPAAMQLLEQSAKASTQFQTVYMESQTATKSSVAGANMNVTMRMWQKKPNKTYMMLQGAGNDMTLISDGQQMLTYYPTKKQYMIQPATADVSQVAGGPGAALSGKQLEAMTKMIQSATIVGSEPVNGQPAKHIKVQIMGSTMDMWLADSTTAPLPLRMTTEMKMGQVSSTMDNTMKWIVDQPIPDSTFTVAAPAGATNMAPAEVTPGPDPAAQAEAVKNAMGQMMPGRSTSGPPPRR